MRVPEDLSVVGFDDMKSCDGRVTPGSRPFGQPLAEMGRTAIRAPSPAPGAHGGPARLQIELPTRLVVHGSTGPPSEHIFSWSSPVACHSPVRGRAQLTYPAPQGCEAATPGSLPGSRRSRPLPGRGHRILGVTGRLSRVRQATRASIVTDGEPSWRVLGHAERVFLSRSGSALVNDEGAPGGRPEVALGHEPGGSAVQDQLVEFFPVMGRGSATTHPPLGREFSDVFGQLDAVFVAEVDIDEHHLGSKHVDEAERDHSPEVARPTIWTPWDSSNLAADDREEVLAVVHEQTPERHSSQRRSYSRRPQ